MILQVQKQTGAGLRQICRVLGAPRSGFYHAAQPSPSLLSDQNTGGLIETIFQDHRRRYGHRRIWRELADQGVVCAPCRVRRLMRQRGLRAIQPKNFTPKTSDGKALRPAPNLLADGYRPTLPDQVWTADITFIPTAEGWLYLAVVMDLCSRRILGWKLTDHLRAELVTDAFTQALAGRPRAHATIFHSDRGSQYGSTAFRAALQRAGFRQSMSARANPYDNAWTESFMGTLKREMLQGGCFQNFQDARIEIFEYIDGYYNTRRKHSSLDQQSPAQFERQSFTSNN
jgi:transposase InsO family protein